MNKRLKHAKPRSFESLLPALMRRFGLAQRIDHSAVAEAWDNCLPVNITERARPTKFRDGVLTVEVSSSPLLDELRCFRTAEFMELLNTHLSGIQIRSIQFRSPS